MKFIIIFLMFFFLAGCKEKEIVIPDEVKLEIKSESIEVFSDAHFYDLIGDTNVKVTTENKLLDTDKVGTHNLNFEFEFEGKKYKKQIDYTVVDTHAPVYISAPTSRTIKVNDDYYPCDEIVFGDNYDRNPSCEVSGEFDLTTVGNYKVEYVIKDTSGNEKRKNLNINVVDAISSSKSNNKNTTTLPLANVIESKKNDNTMIGIDVSRWQENIDFDKVKNAGVEFVIMRMGINSDIDKDISMDTYFKQNIEGARNAGLKVGIYVYSAATSKEKAREHAEWTIDALDNMPLDFPIAFDWENWSKFRKYGISIHDLEETFNEFARVINSSGYETMLYSSKFYLENIWQNKHKYPVWLAHYTNETNYEGDYFLWQMSNVGRVEGINGNVDIDILYKNKTSLDLN